MSDFFKGILHSFINYCTIKTREDKIRLSKTAAKFGIGIIAISILVNIKKARQSEEFKEDCRQMLANRSMNQDVN